MVIDTGTCLMNAQIIFKPNNHHHPHWKSTLLEKVLKCDQSDFTCMNKNDMLAGVQKSQGGVGHYPFTSDKGRSLMMIACCYSQLPKIIISWACCMGKSKDWNDGTLDIRRAKARMVLVCRWEQPNIHPVFLTIKHQQPYGQQWTCNMWMPEFWHCWNS